MSLSNDTAQRRVLLRILFPSMRCDFAPPPGTPIDWVTVDKLARLHRLIPLLSYHLEHDSAAIPTSWPAAWRDQRRPAALAALRKKADLCWLHDKLTQADIPYRALKGAFLANGIYPDAALRPMRDLDILVPEQEVERAFNVLLAEGARRVAYAAGDPMAAILLDRKHLPAIQLPSGSMLELHRKLFKPSKLTELSAQSKFWGRSGILTIADRTLYFLDIEDQLLHLVVHAVDDHLFSNGPLALVDIALMRKSALIDWPLFYHRAKLIGCIRSVDLVFAVVDALEGTLSSEVEAVPDEIIAAALDLSLGARNDSQSFMVTGDRRPRGLLTHLRLVVATEFAVPANSWKTLALLPLMTWRVLLRRYGRKHTGDDAIAAFIVRWIEKRDVSSGM